MKVNTSRIVAVFGRTGVGTNPATLVSMLVQFRSDMGDVGRS